jgi:hypothetical protein
MDRLKKGIPVLLFATFCFLLVPISMHAQEASTDGSGEGAIQSEEEAQSPGAHSMGASSGSFLLGNTVNERGNRSTNHITRSGNDNKGIISVNQASGSLNNQRNERAFVFPKDPEGVSVLSVGTPSAIMANQVHSTGVLREDVISESFNGVTGIVGVNQSSGNMNIQSNTVAIGVGKGLILSEMELGAVCIKENDVTSEKVRRKDMIIDSFNDTRGVVQVNQTSGDAIISKNFMSYTFSNMEVPIP